MFDDHSEAIHELLRRSGVDADALEAVSQRARESGRSLADVLVESGLLSQPDLVARVATELGWRVAKNASVAEPSSAATEAVSASWAGRKGVRLLGADATSADVLAADPFDETVADDVRFALGKEPVLVVGETARPVEPGVQRGGAGAAAAEGPRERAGELTVPEQPTAGELEVLAGQAPVVGLVDGVLARAIREHASDVHFEPFENEFKIRYRIDGVLHELPPPPRALALPVISRLKVLASLDIAERRVPQDGRLRMTTAGRAVDLRVSTLPTQFGESVVLRVLDPSAVQLDLVQLGMPPDVEAAVRETVRRPNGIFIVTGPTGSGKTTTLYGGLRLINTADVKILTAEDPVEYEIDGIMQLPVNPAIGLTFAAALRSFLRQDPDVIMVGEIRDLETAQVAVQASLTGHLVMTTLHTNDAAGAVTRLIDLGVEPFLIAATIEGVLAQRLVRRVCPHCATPYRPESDALASLGLERREADERPWFRGRGCAACAGTGYRGRSGIFEWLPVDDEIRTLITARAPTLLIRERAVARGMRTLRQDALRALWNGVTTVDEVLKYT